MLVSEFDVTDYAKGVRGKVFVVTGGTGGVGKETVLQLARFGPKQIIFTGRNVKRADEVVAAAKQKGATSVDFVSCDLASLASVRTAGQQIASKVDKLDVLVCNAGIMAVPAGLTKDGYEVQFGTNHVGHALLTELLLPALQKAEAGRIVAVTSLGYELAPSGGIQFDTLKTPRSGWFVATWANYGQSKLANILFVRALAKRYPDIQAVAIHPGVVKTDLVGSLSFFNRLFVQATTYKEQVEPQQGAYNQLWAATAQKEEIASGAFYEPVGKEGKENNYSQDAALADKLWEWTQNELTAWL